MAQAATVLVADDEQAILDFVSLVLRQAGFEVLSALGSNQALELVLHSQEPVSLAVLDMMMPNLTGPELFARLQEIYPGMRALFISGYTPPQAGVPAGCDFLAKPFTASELLRSLREAAGRPTVHQA